MTMKKNVGSADRLIRIFLAAVLASAYFYFGLPLIPGGIMLVLATTLLVTSMAGYCPLYSLIGLSTCASHRAAPQDH